MDDQPSAAQVKQPPLSPSSSSWGGAVGQPARPNLLLGKKLTEKQQRIWDMKRPVSEGGEGKKSPDIAAELGISVPVVRKTLMVVYKKLGMSQSRGRSVPVDVKAPTMVAAALDVAADPLLRTRKETLEKINEQLKAAGIPDKISAALMKRLEVKYASAVYAARELKTSDLLEMINKKIDHCGHYLDDKVLSEASARDLMLGMSALIEKRQLLRGEPTSIVSDHERAKLHELLPLLIQEAQRRGLTVDGEVTGKTLEPA